MHSAEHNMIQVMVSQIMFKNPDIEAWRRHLIQQQFFCPKEARELSTREVTLLYRSLLIFQFQRMSPKALMAACKSYQIEYFVDFDDSVKAAAIGY